jgi:repressor LexA
MTTKPALTLKQKAIYEFIKDKIVNRGYGPTVREIGDEFGIKSPNGVMGHYKALEKKGWIEREAGLSRGITLTEGINRGAKLPLAGQIQAGQPLLAEEQTEDIDFSYLFDSNDHFCLKVNGNDLIKDHISDGDHIVIKKQNKSKKGDLVLALVNGETKLMKHDGKKKVDVLGIVDGVARMF